MDADYVKKLISRYESLICSLSGGEVSKHDTDFKTVERLIQEHQAEHHYNIVKSDLQDLIDDGGTILDLQDYINKL